MWPMEEKQNKGLKNTIMLLKLSETACSGALPWVCNTPSCDQLLTCQSLIMLLLHDICLMKHEVKSYPYGDVSLQFLHFTQQSRNQGGFPATHMAHHCQQRALRHHHVNTANTKNSSRCDWSNMQGMRQLSRSGRATHTCAEQEDLL